MVQDWEGGGFGGLKGFGVSVPKFWGEGLGFRV